MMAEKEIGTVFGYFSHVGVAALNLLGKIKVGDKIKIKGHTTDIDFQIKNMQIDRKDVEEADKGDKVGIVVPERVRPNDKVFLLD